MLNNQTPTDERIILKATGSFVAKSEVWKKMNITSTNEWRKELKNTGEMVEGFMELYAEFNKRKVVSCKIAVIILKHVYGEEEQIFFNRNGIVREWKLRKISGVNETPETSVEINSNGH